MATTIKKLNPIGLLLRLATAKSTGCLELDEGTVYWKIYLEQGNVTYVFCSVQSLDQLEYYLHYPRLKQAIPALKHLPSSYLTQKTDLPKKPENQDFYSEIISWLLKTKNINQSSGLELIQYITQDALKYSLWLNNKGIYLWHNQELSPIWIREQFSNSLSINVSKCLSVEQARLQEWQNCSSEILSVHQRPYFNPGWAKKSLPTNGLLTLKTLIKLSKAVKGNISIRHLSVLLHKDELYVAKILSPYIDSKILNLRDAEFSLSQLPNIPQSKTFFQQAVPSDDSRIIRVTSSKNSKVIKDAPVKTWKIVCIDDSPSILKEIKSFLNQEKFEVTVIKDPVQSVSVIFRTKPDLILLDITMPKINGYSLCGLLRGSEACINTPIIMVTGNTSLIDKARAKLAGATDYLTKPFTKQRLTEIVEKHLNIT